MRHRAVVHRHGLVHHDRASTRIEDDLGGSLGARDFDVLDAGHEAHPRARGRRRAHLHHPAVQRAGHAAAHRAIDRFDNALGRAVIGFAQLQVQDAAFGLERRHRALNDAAIGDAAHRELVDLHLAAVGRRARAAHQHVALRDRVDLAVGALEGRHQQGAATQAFGIAHRRHHHVELAAGPCERRQRGGDHHCRHVLELHVLAGRQGDAELREHVGQALRGERRLHGLVAGVVQPHHEAIAHQRVVAHALEVGQVLQPLRVRRAR